MATKAQHDNTLGRPTKCTPALIDHLGNSLTRGVSREVACAAVGITYVTFLKWYRRGKVAIEQFFDGDYDGDQAPDSEVPFMDFYTRIAQGEALAEEYATTAWFEAMPSDWRAAQAFLATRFPDRWSIHKSSTSVNIHSDTKEAPEGTPDTTTQTIVQIYIPDNQRSEIDTNI